MAHHVIEYDEQCKSCKATGLYVGLAERDGSAVVCHTCKGTGCHHVRLEYDDFDGRKARQNVHHVVEVNPGIVIGKGGALQFTLKDFGGMPYAAWFRGEPFPPRSENRNFTCPAWWYQSANSKKKPNWDECELGSFSQCSHFPAKQNCWDRFDREQRRK